MAELKAVGASRSAADRDGGGAGKRANAHLEALSALADDEAQDLELRRVLRELESDESLGEHWYRYHLARGALHGEPLSHAPDFAARVRAAIDEEPVLSSSTAGWKRAFGSFAVAASVTAAVVLGGQQLSLLSGEQSPAVARVAPLPVGVVNTRGAIPVQASFGTGAVPTLEPATRTAYRELARQRMRRYSQEHAEHASLNTPQGMLPFARIPVIEE